MKARRVIAACGLVAVLTVTALWLWNGEDAPTTPVAYVVCGDDLLGEIRAYSVDLLAGEVKGVSEPIKWLGDPSRLAYDPVHSRLYIASMNKKWSPPRWPVTVLWARGGEFKVVKRFSTIRENNVLVQSSAEEQPPADSPEVYKVLVSPDGDELYVSYGGLSDTGALLEVWDANTGEVLRGLPAVIDSNDEWSPDGNHVAVIWPSYEREVNRDGKVTTKTWQGGVVLISTRTGEKSPARRLEDNKNLHPPWGRIDEPYIHFYPYNMRSGDLRIFDRDSGEMISRLRISQLTGLEVGGNPAVAALEGGRLIAVSAVKRMKAPESYPPRSLGWRREGYVLLIDVMDRREITRTRVGERCTNVVVAYEEIEQGA